MRIRGIRDSAEGTYEDIINVIMSNHPDDTEARMNELLDFIIELWNEDQIALYFHDLDNISYYKILIEQLEHFFVLTTLLDRGYIVRHLPEGYSKLVKGGDD